MIAALFLLAVDYQAVTVAEGLRGGYQVVITDLNRDGKPDLIALASGIDELVWFENPTWRRHVIVSGQKRMINCAAHDIDGDGIPEIVLASLFDNLPKNSIGGVSVLRSNGDPRDLWTQTEIDRLTTSHRIRWADIDGSGRKVAVNAPLAGFGADAPDFRAAVPLVFYRPGEWKREVINTANEGVVHGIYVDGRSILTASFLGIHRHTLQGGMWRREEVTKGDPAPWPRSGSSDVAAGDGFLAAIEPWHGHQVVVYEGRRRTVIDTTLDQGHTIQVMPDGTIIAGHRGPKGGVNLYRREGATWRKQVLDETMKANSCEWGDLNGDGRTDIACIGAVNASVKVYYAPRPSTQIGEVSPVSIPRSLQPWIIGDRAVFVPVGIWAAGRMQIVDGQIGMQPQAHTLRQYDNMAVETFMTELRETIAGKRRNITPTGRPPFPAGPGLTVEKGTVNPKLNQP
jgi:hypothetical protein